MTPLEAKIEILKAVMQLDTIIPEGHKEQIIKKRGLNLSNVDHACQVEPIIISKMVNVFYNELNK